VHIPLLVTDREPMPALGCRSNKGNDHMPIATNRGVRIHYEIIGDGPPLVLQHGFTSSLAAWHECGYVDALRTRYRLVLVDARGHGLSDKPHDEQAYGLERRVADVTAVLDALSIARAHFWGYSMGGTIGFGMAKYAPHRLNALVIGGQHPYAVDRARLRTLVQVGIAEGADAFVAGFRLYSGAISAAQATRLREADYVAWLAMLQDSDSMAGILSGMLMPCCVYASDGDSVYEKAKLASQHMPNARFVAVSRLSHRQAFAESGYILPQVTGFLGEYDGDRPVSPGAA
jgi:pimeloyl-ACP methyl ester carboxylesterase